MTTKHNLWKPANRVYRDKPISYRMVKLAGKRGVWWLDYMHNGKRIRVSLSIRDRREANKRRKIWIKNDIK